MKHLAPSSYRAFVCAAGACPDSCCRAGWEIVIDPDTCELYRTLCGPAAERVRKGVVPPVGAAIGRPPEESASQLCHSEPCPEQGRRGSEESVPLSPAEPLLRQDKHRVCVLLDPDGLCHVQRNYGHEALCKVCRDYPRFRRDFGGLTEHGLSLSCPTAYALATSAPPAWEEWEDDAPPIPNELDPESYLRLRKGRELALDLLTREELSLETRLTLLRRLAAAMQSAPERRVKHDYALRLRRWESLPVKYNSQFSTLNSQLLRLARRFLSLEILSPAWKDALERFAAMAEAGSLPAGMLTLPDPEPYARWLWYELYKYWMDALDDGMLLARVDRALDMLLLGLAMDQALPGEGPFLRRISREIEHCEENLAALLK